MVAAIDRGHRYRKERFVTTVQCPASCRLWYPLRCDPLRQFCLMSARSRRGRCASCGKPAVFPPMSTRAGPRLPIFDFITISTLRRACLGTVPGDLLAGVVVALALIPEALAFSIIAGVDPQVGLYAAFSIAVVCAIAGGRPGMISAATGAVALVIASLVRDHGVQYVFATAVLAGLLQIGAGWLKLGALMRFVSRSVITGFVNALAILIFLAQLPELTDMPWTVYAMTAGGLA